MVPRTLLVMALLAPLAGHAAGTDAFSSLHPEEAIPNATAPVVAPGPHSGFISRVQEKLIELGFDTGPINGDLGEKTQAALAQFQLSRTIPAGGQLDDLTLAELGVAREEL